jgi:phosphatidylserine/phosphatidylglycerophosphate/cardiolipin synthase-like enzyme
MRNLPVLLLLAAVSLGASSKNKEPAKPAPPVVDKEAQCELRFSPDGGCTAAIVEELEDAEKTIQVLAYSFTSDPITEALLRAKARGVEVRAIIDNGRTAEKSGDVFKLYQAGVEAYSDGAHAIQHQKVILIDADTPRARVILGSFNFTGAAEHSNSENLMIVKDQEVAKAFATNWELHRGHSKPYAPPETVEKKDETFYLLLYLAITAGVLVLICRKKLSRRP